MQRPRCTQLGDACRFSTPMFHRRLPPASSFDPAKTQSWTGVGEGLADANYQEFVNRYEFVTRFCPNVWVYQRALCTKRDSL